MMAGPCVPELPHMPSRTQELADRLEVHASQRDRNTS